MKTSKLFFITVCLVIFGSICEVEAQNTKYSGTGNVPIGGTINSAFGDALNASTTGKENVAVGNEALKFNGLDSSTSGTFASKNVAVGFRSLNANTFGANNTAIGHFSALLNTTGGSNVAVGAISLRSNSIGNFNVALGVGSGQSSLGHGNTFIGADAGKAIASGSYNTIIGNSSAINLSGTSSGNVIIGRPALPLAPLLNNTIVLATGGSSTDGLTRLYIDKDGNAGFNLGNFIAPKNILDIKGGVAIGTTYASGIIDPLIITNGGTIAPTSGLIVEGNTGIGTNTPSNRLEIKSGVSSYIYDASTGTSGLTLTNLKSGNTNLLASTGKVLTVDPAGIVVLTNDVQGGITNSCAQGNFITKTNGTTGNLSCSQIFDDGVGVGVGYTSIPVGPNFFYYSATGIIPLLSGASNTATAKLDVNGIIRTIGIYASSDKKFKKDIKSIENALTTIEKIDGKTYLWDTEKFKDKNFDGGGHSGFIAQELEKVLPHLVITGQNGEKAVNYMELLPYLVEAIKEQQTQINELKAQVNDNFKSQNGDLLTLKNTKIISVSPNPSNDVILVSMNIEKVVQNAKLLVHDINGLVLSTLNINERDTNITKTLQKDNFGKGIYIVDLVVNGKSIDTKKIVFN